jgi:hypothetical protein
MIYFQMTANVSFPIFLSYIFVAADNPNIAGAQQVKGSSSVDVTTPTPTLWKYCCTIPRQYCGELKPLGHCRTLMPRPHALSASQHQHLTCSCSASRAIKTSDPIIRRNYFYSSVFTSVDAIAAVQLLQQITL